MRAVVGRGKEGRALAELELMSSNSPDVGEMWNGQAIVRVFGAPQIFQFVYTPDLVQSDPVRAVSILADGNPFFERSRKRGRSLDPPSLWNGTGDVEMRPLLQDPIGPGASGHTNDGKHPPNISINARGKVVGNYEKWLMAIIGIVGQAAVLVYEGLISYHPSWKTHFLKNNLSPSRQAFPCTAVGTVSLTIGMLICSYVIDCASTEEDWVLKGRRSCKVAWIQKGGTVNDQVFGPYIISGHEGQKIIKTSYRCDTVTTIRLRWWVLLGALASVAGFVVQFIGLRGMHWSATIAQLVATGLMTVIRSFVRRRMFKEPNTIPAIEGYELDSMAREMNECSGWVVVPRRPEHTSPMHDKRLANSVLQIRIRLCELSQWSTDVQDITVSLCTAMERTINAIYRSNEIRLTEDALQQKELLWKLGVLTLGTGEEDHASYGELEFKITRPQSWGSWEVSDNTKRELTSVLSLWMLRFREQEKRYQDALMGSGVEDLRIEPNKGAKVLVWPRHKADQELFKLWIGFHPLEILYGDHKDISQTSRIPEHQFVGELNTKEDVMDIATVAIVTNVPVEKFFAQQLFSYFFSQVVPLIKEILGPTRIYQDDKGESDKQEIRNITLTQLADTICQTGLGTKVEILVDIVSHFGIQGKLPELEGESGGRVLQLHIKDNKRRSRINGNWEMVASHIQQAIGGYEWVLFPEVAQLEAWGAWQMAARFCKRICALAGWGEEFSNTSAHPQSEFPEWLVNLKNDDLPLAPEILQPQGDLVSFPITIGAPDSETLGRVRRLLAPFSPVYPKLTDSKEVLLLRSTINIATKEELLPVLRKAVMSGYDSVVEVLMDRKIDTRQADNTTESPLVLAASQGRNSVIQLLLFQLKLNFPKDYHQFQAGYQPISLWAAAACGQTSTVRLLLMYMTGAHEVPYKECALVLAALNGHIETVDFLYGSDRTSVRKGALLEGAVYELGISKGSSEFKISWWGCDRVVGAELEESPIQFEGVEGGYQASIIYHLIKSGIHTSSDAILARTALQAAAGGGHLEVVDRLIERGATINAGPAQSHGRTALQAAAGGGHLTVVDRLIEKGATINAEPARSHGRIALQAAAENRHLDVVDRLRSAGAL